jgi:multidrug efflux pump subunit AcrA (membrane-fusion protein)
VRVTLDNPPDMFLLGTTIQAMRTIDVSPRIDLPPTALLERDGKTAVWVVDPRANTVGLRDVEIAGARAGVSS